LTVTGVGTVLFAQFTTGTPGPPDTVAPGEADLDGVADEVALGVALVGVPLVGLPVAGALVVAVLVPGVVVAGGAVVPGAVAVPPSVLVAGPPVPGWPVVVALTDVGELVAACAVSAIPPTAATGTTSASMSLRSFVRWCITPPLHQLLYRNRKRVTPTAVTPTAPILGGPGVRGAGLP
jgi:hypothetical protein